MSEENNTQPSSGPAVAESSDSVLDSAIRSAFEDASTPTEEAGTEQVKTPEDSAPEEEEKPQEQLESEEDLDLDPVDPPASLDAEEREVFAKLPREFQEFISRRELQRDRAVQQRFTEIKRQERELAPYAEMAQMAHPFMMQWGLEGVSPAQVFGRMLATQQFLETDPINAINHLEATYGITREQRYNEGTDFSDPTLTKLREVEEKLSRLEMEKAQQHEAQQLQTIQRDLQNFRLEKDASGNPAHPFFDEVIQDMTPIVAHLEAQYPNESPQRILKEAYDRAVYANPTTRGRMMTQSAREAKAKLVQEAKAKSDQARKAGSTLKSSNLPVSTSNGADLDSIISDALDQFTR